MVIASAAGQYEAEFGFAENPSRVVRSQMGDC